MKFESKTFYFVWFAISIIAGLLVVGQFSSYSISLPRNSFNLGQKINEPCKNPKDPTSCDISRSSYEIIDVSLLSKQLEGFDNFFPLSAIAKLNLKASNILESNVYLEVTYPKYSKKISNIKISCAEEDPPRFDSEKPEVEFKNIRPVSVSALVFNYFMCERPRIRLVGPSDKNIVIGPNEFVKFVTQGDGIVITQDRSVVIDPNGVTKTIIFFIIFFLGLGAGSLFYPYLKVLGLIKEEKDLGDKKIVQPEIEINDMQKS